MSPSIPSSHNTHLGLGYSPAIALALLYLLLTLLLSSYLCCGATRHHIQTTAVTTAAAYPSHGVVLPLLIFVAEHDDDDEEASVAPRLDQSVNNSYPLFQFDRDNARICNGNNNTCSLCLCEYKDSEMLRMMPESRHFFHFCCIDSWLKLRGTCPVCRNSPHPTPLSTPLKEVVQLTK